MKKMLTMTTALFAVGALAACSDSTDTADTYDDTEMAAENTYDESTDTEMASMDEDTQGGYGADATVANPTGYNAPGDLSATERRDLEMRLGSATTPTIDYNGNTYITHAALNARDVTGADVIGEDGEVVASVDDVIVDADGNAQMLVLSSGGFLGLGDKQITVDFAQASIEMDEDEARFVTSLTEDGIDGATEFDEAALGADMMMASDLIGDEVMLGSVDATETASVYDLIMNTDGKTEYAVLSTGLGSDRYLVDFSALQPGNDDETWMIAMTPDRLMNEDRVTYL
ncbi:PRC-barrel domain-containing protein [Aquisalinus flavus]|uniref:PRC-barrel domain-containing protein n=1 Tax=Aquisalinus flavus TaxID=1526572 RepID=A0A8J2Y3U4_9PROT|nr:PRC-barrel domain-containing protein [Aquisalinus flavus]MBD0426197.1 PRC-barrel domain-containing protein [Aquisalinus flavus]UNE48229.1 PRC-barrel domain containing protein [Aquisalinus flavus]GGD09828.1 hypothetical protein GCM10011342_18410 [Aquisalinus flavus]